jgi:iron complex outermembrane receptor protein
MPRRCPAPASARLFAGPPVLCALLVFAPPVWAADSEQESGKEDGVPTVVVSDSAGKHTGSTAEGYRVTDFTIGPLGPRPALDTPFQTQTIPQDLIRNQAVTDNAELLKYLPSTQIEYRGGSEVGRPQSRGFEADLLGNTRIDGFAVQSHIPQPIEMTDHLDVLNGLSGAFYGPMNPAGVFNYVLKRPTEHFVNDVGLAYQSDGNVTERADLGGRVGPDRMFGYRLNLSHTDGETASETANLRREVASLAVDARVTSSTLIEANAARYIYDRTGSPGSFAVATGINARVPDASKIDPRGYGYDWAGVETTIDYYGGKITQALNQDWSVTGGLMRQNVTRIMRSTSNRMSTSGNAYQVQVSEAFAHWELTSNQLYLNGKVETGPLKHELTFGTNGYVNPNFSAYNTAAASRTTAYSCIITETSCSASALKWKTDGGFYRTGLEDRYQTAIIGDTITLNDQWSVMGVFSNGWISSDSATPGKSISVDNAQSYTAGLIYKPRHNMSLYANHGSSVLPGERAASSGVANPNEPLSPYRSTQWEVGYKVELADIDLNTALFHITRPTAYAGDDNVYRVQGEQRNRGIELMAKGKVTDQITVFGGVTWLDSEVTKTDTALTEGKQAIGVPEWQANLLTEYAFSEAFLPGITSSLNLHYTGERAANAYNTAWAGGFTTVDLGIRYSGEVIGRAITANLKVNNLFDERYWASVFPSNIAGDSTSSGSTVFIGEPRTVKASMTMSF